MADISELTDTTNGSVLTNIGDRVRVKEKARDVGLALLQEIPKVLQPISNRNHKQDVKDWETNLQNLKRTSQSREILVGIQGETGLGKSSLLNELLRCDIVPTSQEEACTAAACIYRYNHEVGGNKRYMARITFKSWATVEAELDGLKEELLDSDNHHEAQDDDPDYDGGYNYYIDQHIHMVCAWSGLNGEDIQRLSSIEIMQKGNFNKIRGRGTRWTSDEKTCEKTITAPNGNQFKKILKLYAESSNLRSHQTQYWPLVEQVEVYLKAPILRHGIKLVDLPGTQDALAFRAEIAETFQDRLMKQIFVTPASRAGDNKAAADLIFTENDLMKFHLDNKFKSNSLCVVITRIDDINTRNATEEFPTEEIIELHARLRGPPPEESEDEEFGSDPEDYTRVHFNHSSNKRKSTSATSKNVKRQKNDSHEADEPRTTTGRSEAQKAGKEAMEEDESLLTYLCIQERNRRMVQNVAGSLLKAAEKHSSSEAIASSIPAVFPVSSHAYNEIKNGREFKGFPDTDSTGIPALGSWLGDISLPIREEWVDNDIHHIQVLFDAAYGWTHDDFNTLPTLTTDEIKKIRQAVQDISDSFKHITKDLRRKIQSQLICMKPLRKKNLRNSAQIKTDETGEAQLERSFKNLAHSVKGWEKKNPKGHASSAGKDEKLHWTTYKACTKRCGSLYRPVPKRGVARRNINWMADVHTSFWRGHHEKWQTAFSRVFPTIKNKVRGTVHGEFDKWIKLFESSEELPTPFLHMVRKNSYKMENIFLLFTDKILTSMNTLRHRASRMSKIDVLSTLAKEMKPGFEAAFKKKGKGIMKKQSEEISKHATNVGLAMFETVRDDLERKLRHEVHEVVLATKGHWDDPKDGCGAMMRKEFKRIATRLCAKRTMKNEDNSSNEETEKRLVDLISLWRKEWHSVQSRLPQAAPLVVFDDHDDDEIDEFAKEDEIAEAKARDTIVPKTEPDEHKD
ncbi:hypothetical protein CORC01_11881 [Colletotrichum orchidophilum]|uniref:Tat pathway signal sequence n=1 Tax=Colletotrichum orchidophilum TaxID=1209926 RepID=A0A1G4AUP4_9PEZI|nr:uncharacterized protein CORC01_11881 [Colletotrichum orchidophilum]OHE92803.1 hypothetical protein CORC01_11881 [Colletotrichum orchidophilum]